MNISFSPPDIADAEIEEVIDTLKSGWITTGPKTKQFEKDIASYCNTSKAVCLNSATAALELTLRVLGIGEGDEVITSAYTYSASASVICHVGATPVLVDTAENSYEMDYDRLENAITAKTKVIIPVDIGGVPCDYERLYQIIENKRPLFQASNEIQRLYGRIILLADAAHAFGAKRGNKMCGEIADFTCFSFHAVKNLTCAEGGSVTWRNKKGLDNEALYKEYMLLSLHGQSKDALAKTKLGSWEYDIVAPYYKCNMTDIMASIGLAQLRRYDEILKRRKTILEMYYNGLKGEQAELLQHYTDKYQSSGHLNLVRLIGQDIDYRNAFIVRLAERGISANVHYKPLPLLTAYKNLGFCMEDYPNAYNMYKNEVTLPLHTLMTDEQVEYIIDNFKELIRE